MQEANYDESHQIHGERNLPIRHIQPRHQSIDAARKQVLSENFVLTMFDETPAAFVAVDQDGIVLMTNKFTGDLLGCDLAELIGTPLSSLWPELEKVAWSSHLRSCFDSLHVLHHRAWLSNRPDGRKMWIRQTIKTVENISGAPVAFVAFEDDTRTRELNEHLSYRESHDVLTGLYNRTEFGSQLSVAVRNAQLDSSNSLLAYLDLDQFKIINDTCDHVAGDELLRQISALLASRIRVHDTLGRLGGDEFGILLQDCPIDKGLVIIEGICKSIEEHRFVWCEMHYRIGVSIGVVPINSDTQSAQN